MKTIILFGGFSFLFASFSGNAQSDVNYYPPSGSVGIGTNSPLSRFHIKGTANNPAWISVDKSSSSEEAGLMFRTESNIKFYLYSDNTDGEGLKMQANWELDATPRLHIPYTNKNLYLVQSGGNVGIGTTNPVQKLDVVGNVSAGEPGLYWQGFRSNAPSKVWGFQQNDHMMVGIGGDVYSRGFSANAMGIFNGSTTKEDIFLYNQNHVGGDFLVLKNSGNVGIGTVDPQAKLAVNGDVFSKKVKVTQTGWPDYVFEPTYQLPSLQEVEAFIKQYKHLPDVPSAKEVAANGLDLGDNQAVLLKKIEELTLYIIKQEKEIESLKEANKKIEALQLQLDNIHKQIQKN